MIEQSTLQEIDNPELKEIPDSAYDTKNTYELKIGEQIWRDVEKVYNSANECACWVQDENAWSDEVVRPALTWENGIDEFYAVVNV